MTRRRRAIVVLIAPLKRARLVPSVGAIATSLAVWVSFGTIGFDVPGGSRIGLLPVAWWYPLVALAPAGVVFWILNRSTRQGGEGHSTLTNLTPLLPLALLALPWLPFRVPAVFLIWTGAVTTLVWVAVAMALAATVIRGNWVRIAFGPGASCLAAGALSLLVFSTAAWSAAGRLPAGDEPHYLIITQSLLLDHDLKIENNHRRGDYRAYVGADLYPDSVRRGRNGELYSIHSPGLPLLVLPAFAIGGYRAVVMFLLVLASAGGALAWWLAWRVTKSSSAAWFGWAVVVMSPPFLLESFTIYPDAPGATIVLTGFWALLRADWDVETRSSSWLPWLAHGAALGVLPWLHTRFSVIAATLGGLILIRLARTSNAVAKASAFLALPAVSALAWLGFFVVIYGTLDPSAPYGGQMQNSFSFLPDGVGGLFFDQGFGLLTTAPVLVVAFAGLRRSPRLALDWLVIAIPYLLAVTTFAMWWAGWSGPARFFVPLLLPLAIFAACGWQAIRERGTRASVAAAFVATCWLSLLLVFVNGAQLAYHGRNPLGVTGAPWIDWAVHFVNIRLALPAFVPLPFGTSLAARDAAARSGFLTLAPWVICLTVAAIALRIVGRRVKTVASLAGLTAVIYGVAASLAMAICWGLGSVPPLNVPAAQMEMLHDLSRGHVLALDLTRLAQVSSNELARRTRIVVQRRRQPTDLARFAQPLVVLPSVPAGDFLVSARRRGGDGWIIVGIAADQFSLLTKPAHMFDAGIDLRLPVDVQTLIVGADEEGRQQIGAVEIQPLRLFGPGERVTDRMASRAVRYGETNVFFLDDCAFPEPAAFWVGGGSETRIVLEPDRGGGGQALLFRNAPVVNTVTLRSGSWGATFVLTPEEQRRVVVPVDPSRGAALLEITSAAGFRPAVVDPTSRDMRYLGVYVQPE